MNTSVDSDNRMAGDFVLFALGFLGVMVAVAGVELNSIAAAVLGFFLLLLVVLCFGVMEA